jgi:SPP1 family predicted phage head-tail adaptor
MGGICMRSGSLDKIIDLQAPTKISDGIGGFTESYTTVYSNVWASIWPIRAKDQIQSDQMIGTITHRIRMRHKRVLKSSWRIKFGNRYFAIVAPPINPNEANIKLELLCKEVEA